MRLEVVVFLSHFSPLELNCKSDDGRLSSAALRSILNDRS